MVPLLTPKEKDMRYRHVVSLLALAAAITFMGPVSNFSPLSADKVLADRGGGSGGANSDHGSDNSGHGNSHDNGHDDGDSTDDNYSDDDPIILLPSSGDDDSTPDQGSGDN